jgi:hypothetical protein
MDGLSVMEVLAPPCAVLLSHIHLPIVFYPAMFNRDAVM